MPIFATVLTSTVFYCFCLGLSKKKKKKVVVKANTCMSSEEEPAFAPKNLTTFFHANCPTRVRARLISTAGISSGVSVTLNKQNKNKKKKAVAAANTQISHAMDNEIVKPVFCCGLNLGGSTRSYHTGLTIPASLVTTLPDCTEPLERSVGSTCLLHW